MIGECDRDAELFLRRSDHSGRGGEQEVAIGDSTALHHERDLRVDGQALARDVDRAERIAATLTAAGQPADARPSENAGDLAGDDAFVIGASAYYGHWLRPATEFIRAHKALLADRPVWLFSSGPLGTETTAAPGHDLREAALPKELGQLRDAIQSRGDRVFFGALDPDGLTLPERTVRRMPAGRALLPEGDFRDWQDIDAWAGSIARERSGPRPATPEPDSHVPT